MTIFIIPFYIPYAFMIFKYHLPRQIQNVVLSADYNGKKIISLTAPVSPKKAESYNDLIIKILLIYILTLIRSVL